METIKTVRTAINQHISKITILQQQLEAEESELKRCFQREKALLQQNVQKNGTKPERINIIELERAASICL